MQRKQAAREKALAVFQSMINTALIVTAALTIPGPAGIILAGIVGAMGLVQTTAILATPLPGAEDGGFLVERAQDGKKFNARHDPRRRGYIPQTSVIVSEAGKEYVASAEAVKNPTIRPILDITGKHDKTDPPKVAVAKRCKVVFRIGV